MGEKETKSNDSPLYLHPVGKSFYLRTENGKNSQGLFWEVRMGFWWDIALNILLFIPLGFLLGDKGCKAVFLGFLLSAFIEFIQYIAVLGYCE